jgi:hypothetical protein
MGIAGHVSSAMLSRYSHVPMEAKRRALDQIAARQRAADEKRKEEAAVGSLLARIGPWPRTWVVPARRRRQVEGRAPGCRRRRGCGVVVWRVGSIGWANIRKMLPPPGAYFPLSACHWRKPLGFPEGDVRADLNSRKGGSPWKRMERMRMERMRPCHPKWGGT